MTTPRHRSAQRPPARRGAATLVVVMVLFFIVAMVAAYTSRNLIFEQRTSGNQYRATLALEAADAGVEWALARLNDGRMNMAPLPVAAGSTGDCRQLASAAAVSVANPEPSFREHYLSIDVANGLVAPVAGRLAGCVFDGTDWICDCPASGEPNPTFVANGPGPHVAFWVRFVAVPTTPTPRPGLVRVEVNACTRLEPACLRFNREAQPGDGIASVSALLALRSALSAPPAAPLTVRGNTTVGTGAGNSLTLVNTDATAAGVTVHAANTFPSADAVLVSLPGTPGVRSVRDGDTTLRLLDTSPPIVPDTPANRGADRMFARQFGMWFPTYAEQPGVVTVDCSAGCTSAPLNEAALLHPGHAIVATGAGPVTLDATVGGPTTPVVLVVPEAQVVFSGAGTVFHGVVYNRRATWNTSGDGSVNGAWVAESDLVTSGAQTLTYDGSLLLRARWTVGSFVKVPGGWRDFTP